MSRITLDWEGVQGVIWWDDEGCLGLPVCIMACLCIFLSVHCNNVLLVFYLI